MTLRRYALLAVVVLSAALPLTALATNPFKDIEIAGVPGTGGSFKGMLSVERFERGMNQVLATVSITGSYTDGAGKTVRVTGHTLSLVATVSATCEGATVELAPGSVEVAGGSVGLTALIITVAKTDDQVGRILCQIAKAVAEPAADSPAASKLNRLLDELR